MVGTGRAVRADIQALRAIAVGLVILYHFWPWRLSGGYIGVDIFFVISGFLISTHLFQNVPTRPRDLAEFWGRRIRRLLPAALIVIAVALWAAMTWAPVTTWKDTAWQTIASAFYVQNWALAAQSVDYLGQDSAQSAVQHYWSLSVEEQFYLVWPVLFFVVATAARRSHRSRAWIIGAVLAAVTIASFVYSVIETPRTTGAYYFSTTRAWELGLGGIIAFAAIERSRWFSTVPRWLRYAGAGAGLAMICYPAATYDSATPFPGWHAAVPVIGTALVILAAVDEVGGWLAELAAFRPVQYIGDISYSLYLWHWPFVVIVPYALGHPMTWSTKMVCLAITIVLSGLTKRFVEDRFRGRRPLGVPLRRSFAFAIVGAILVTVATVPSLLFIRRQAVAHTPPAVTASEACYGAAALRNKECQPHGEDLVTSPEFIKNDRGPAWANNAACITGHDFQTRKVCHFGIDDPNAVQVALVGNSHAAQYLPTMIEIARRHDWSITTYLIFECYSVTVPIAFPNDTARTPNCQKWNRDVTHDLQSKNYDLIVTSNRTFRKLVGVPAGKQYRAQFDAYSSELAEWTKSGTPVLDIRDPPIPPHIAVDCVALHPRDLSACDGTRAETNTVDPQADAAESLHDPLVEVVDLNRDFCRGDTCYAVIGGVIAFANKSHLSATFARTLAPDVERAALDLIQH